MQDLKVQFVVSKGKVCIILREGESYFKVPCVLFEAKVYKIYYKCIPS